MPRANPRPHLFERPLQRESLVPEFRPLSQRVCGYLRCLRLFEVCNVPALKSIIPWTHSMLVCQSQLLVSWCTIQGWCKVTQILLKCQAVLNSCKMAKCRVNNSHWKLKVAQRAALLMSLCWWCWWYFWWGRLIWCLLVICWWMMLMNFN